MGMEVNYNHATSIMKRRAFLALVPGSLLAAPLTAEGQQAGKVWRVGLLSSASASAAVARTDAFKDGLRELGYIEGQNLAIEYRWAEGREDRLSALAAELVRLSVDIIVTQGTVATLVARRAKPTMPVVFAVAGDPVEGGLVANLTRPAGTVTGLAVLGAEPKRLELLREMVPRLTRIVALWNPRNASSVPELKATEGAARTLGMQFQSIEARDARELDGAFAAIVKQRAEAVMVLSDSMLFGQRAQIGDLATRNRLPAIAWTREFIDGLLMAYGPNVVEMYRRAATYVDKILKGAKPGDLPVEQPTKFELLINLRIAKVLGLTIPPSLLLRADQVIDP
jgi:putative tryptophan/tyrosine transport system substrate-binding protein